MSDQLSFTYGNAMKKTFSWSKVIGKCDLRMTTLKGSLATLPISDWNRWSVSCKEGAIQTTKVVRRKMLRFNIHVAAFSRPDAHLGNSSRVAEPSSVRLHARLRSRIECGLIGCRTNDFSLFVSFRFEISVHLKTANRSSRSQMTSLFACQVRS